MKVADVFSAARWRACWATTFTFEPAFFEAFLVRRLGDPPFNVVVLGDAGGLAETWGAIGPHDAWRVPGLNNRYLTRGIDVPGGAFHAKTMLLGNDKRGTLLVGSGNVGLSGLEHGNEVYTRLDLDAEPTAFAAWRDWTGDIVARLDDPIVRSRWADLLLRLPWLGPIEPGPTPFVTNRVTPLLDQLMSGLATPVDELHLTAPFFDHGLLAIGRLIERAQPRQLTVYLGRDASVDGAGLASLLRASTGESRVLAYAAADGRGPTYVHAKVIAVVSGGYARLLAGSANLSRPALMALPWTGSGNVEAGVIRDLPAADARALIAGGNQLILTDLGDDQVRSFVLATMAPGVSYPVRLISATRGADGLIRIVTDGAIPEPLFLTDGRASVALVNFAASAPLGPTDGSQLVWLVTANEEPQSNRVPVDDQLALESILNVQQTTGDERPRELDPLDIRHPLGRILFDLHLRAVFDIDDTPASRRLDATKTAEAVDPDADAFWGRFFQEELGRDPRTTRYRGLGGGQVGDDLFLDEFGALLLQMLARAPALGQLRLLDGTIVSREDAERDGVPWTEARRIRARAFNVLARWATAVADPRVRWFGDFAAVSHYEALLGALAQIWPQARAERDEDRWLTADQLMRLFAVLHGAFVRTERSVGFVAGASDDERGEIIERLSAHGAPPIAAALAYDAMRTAKPATYFEWQPFLVPALAWGVIEADDRTVEFLQEGLGLRATLDDVERVLHRAADYIDDDRWCSQVADSLGFDRLALRKSGNPHFPSEFVLPDTVNLRRDPRVPTFVRLALGYARTPFRTRAGRDIVAVALGRTVAGRLDGAEADSLEVLTPDILDHLEREGLGLGALFESGDLSGVA
jgi:hypothetical protein